VKPRSIISLIIAAVFVLAGIITCVIAEGIAKNDGVMLFPKEDTTGNLYYEMNLSGIKKLNISTSDANITIHGGAERSYIRILNFNANYYKMSMSGGTLIFNQVDDFLSMFKFWDNGFSFKGMRYILRSGDDTSGKKQIEVYLSDADAVTGITLSTEVGAIRLQDLSYYASYSIKLGGGSADFSDVTGATSLNITNFSENEDINTVTMDNVTVKNLSVKSHATEAVLKSVDCDKATLETSQGSVKTEKLTAESLTANLGECDFFMKSYRCTEGKFTSMGGDISFEFDTSDFTAIVSTVNGKISDNGTYVESFSRNSAGAPYRAEVSTRSGDVSIAYPAA